LPGSEAFRQQMNLIEDAKVQHSAVADYFDGLAAQMDRLPMHALSLKTDETEELSVI
jgi:tRNA-dihydrouridine synthase B